MPVQRAVLPSAHCPQAPVGSQAGVAPPHSASPAQARQVCVARLHTGAVPAHWASATHATHVPAPTSHAGVAPVQADAFEAEHWPQVPSAWQAGVAPPHSPSPPHARQVCVVASQTGAAPPHWAFEVQATQVPDVR